MEPNGHARRDGFDGSDGHDSPADSAGYADLGPLGSSDYDGVLNEIASLDLVNTTPLEALNRLFAMQRRLRELATLPVVPLPRPERRARRRGPHA